MKLKMLLASFIVIICMHAIAQNDYPNRPVTLVFPYPPAASGDAEVRQIANHLQKELGWPFVVDYRAGATGTLGGQFVQRSSPDGYTLLVGSATSMITGPMVMNKLPYDALADFQPITAMFRTSALLVVPADRPYRTVQDLIVDLRARPGKLNYGSVGNGALSHLLAEGFLKNTGTQAVHVPYKGGAQADLALISGEIDFLFSSAQLSAPLIKAGKMKALAAATERRVPLVAEVPTLLEQGIPVTSGLWFALFAPKGTPSTVVTKLSDAVNDYLNQKTVVAGFISKGLEPLPGSAEQLKSRVTADLNTWGSLIKTLNFQ